MQTLAGSIVALAALWLVGLAWLLFARPAVARRFLGGFATSARAHYLEIGLRMLAGAALVTFAPASRVSQILAAFGWLLLGTSAALALVPWTWHHRFAERAVPLATRWAPLMGLVSLALGGFLVYAVLAR